MNDNECTAKFRPRGDDGLVDMAPGIRRRTLVWSEQTLIAEFRLAAGSAIPMHDHPQEQTGFLVSGRMRFIFENDAREVAPGDSWVIPGGVRHAAEIVEDTIAVEVFSPPRDDYK